MCVCGWCVYERGLSLRATECISHYGLKFYITYVSCAVVDASTLVVVASDDCTHKENT